MGPDRQQGEMRALVRLLLVGVSVLSGTALAQGPSFLNASLQLNPHNLAACEEECGNSAVFTARMDNTSFLEVGEQPKVIPMQSPFQVKCVCTSVINVPSNMKLPMEIPFGKCAATEVTIAMKEDGTGMSPE